MNLGCITELPCPCRKDIDGIGHCMKNEGDCEYQILEESALEKIIAKLEEIKNPMYREDGSLMSQKTFVRIDTAIEIVKQFIR